MGIHFKQGFTIIETMLVLAVTGVLVATLLVGVGSSINAQRYKDSVSTFASTLQSQYSQVDNVTNVRDTSATCGSSAVQVDVASGVAPGQSDCVLMGRYVTVVDDTIHTASILGYTNPNVPHKNATNDISDVTMYYQLGISQSSVTTSTLEWGAAIAWPKAGSVDVPTSPIPSTRSIGILIIRSPVSGTTYTFTSDTAYDMATVSSADLMAMMLTTNTVPGQQQRFICVDPSPGSTVTIVPEKLSVSIGPAAADSSAIELRSDTTTASVGGDTKCQ